MDHYQIFLIKIIFSTENFSLTGIRIIYDLPICSVSVVEQFSGNEKKLTDSYADQ